LITKIRFVIFSILCGGSSLKSLDCRSCYTNNAGKYYALQITFRLGKLFPKQNSSQLFIFSCSLYNSLGYVSNNLATQMIYKKKSCCAKMKVDCNFGRPGTEVKSKNPTCTPIFLSIIISQITNYVMLWRGAERLYFHYIMPKTKKLVG
jgi:hypothetical protein